MHRSSLPIKPIDTSKFFVVTMISNPQRYRVRYDLYRKFAKHVADSGASLMTVEVAYGDRPFEITEPGNPWNLQLRTKSEVWHKENALNLGVAHTPMRDFQQVAWIDADVDITRPDWVQETVQQLQHHDVVQLWSVANDLMPNLEPFRTYRSFCSCYQNSIRLDFDNIAGEPGVGSPLNPDGGVEGNGILQSKDVLQVPIGGYYGGTRPYWHSGFAWAMRRQAWDDLGGLIEHGVLGAGDHHMALALIGEAKRSMPGYISKAYLDLVMEWEARATRYIKRNIGVVPGLLNHFHHGPKIKRRYNARWNILKRHEFDPHYDLKRDSNGLWQLTDRNFRLRDDLRSYFSQRDEDSLEVG